MKDAQTPILRGKPVKFRVGSDAGCLMSIRGVIRFNRQFALSGEPGDQRRVVHRAGIIIALDEDHAAPLQIAELQCALDAFPQHFQLKLMTELNDCIQHRGSALQGFNCVDKAAIDLQIIHGEGL